MGSWHCLLAARSALPEWDLLWTWAALRSLGPAEDVNIRTLLRLPLAVGPAALVLAACGFLPLVETIWSYFLKNPRNERLYVAGRCVLLTYCSLLLVAYPLSYEEWGSFYKIDGVKYDGQYLTNDTHDDKPARWLDLSPIAIIFNS